METMTLLDKIGQMFLVDADKLVKGEEAVTTIQIGIFRPFPDS